jgi:hypothetical protein
MHGATSSNSLTCKQECPRDCEHTALLRFCPNNLRLADGLTALARYGTLYMHI